MILISAGEASGDSVGAALAEEIRVLRPDCRIVAVGGKRLRGAGAEIVEDSTRWGAIGLVQSLLLVPKVYAAFLRVKRWIKRSKPELIVAIDFGAFNVRLCRFAKAQGCKVLYFMPPGSWRRSSQGQDLKEIADVIATPFKWSAEMLGAEWVGHPLVQMIGEVGTEQRSKLAIMPGSREHEIELLLPIMAQAIDRTDIGDLRPEIVCAPSADAAKLQSVWDQNCSKPATISHSAVATLKASNAGIVCSGTATLEAAICGVPMVIVYKVPWWSELEARIIRFKIQLIGMPNILMGRMAFPELIQHQATAERMSSELSKILSDGEHRNTQLSAMEQLNELLGPQDAVTRTAKLVVGMLTPSTGTAQHPS